jgi:hypothetical protein
LCLWGGVGVVLFLGCWGGVGGVVGGGFVIDGGWVGCVLGVVLLGLVVVVFGGF